jgi:DNA (cytosine-5)-methyltransferase 1
MLAAGYVRYEVPDPARKGEYFDAWFKDMEEEGYVGDWRLLRSADYGDPTIRQRLFVYFCRKDSGKRIVWPNPTHGRRDKVTGLPPAGLKPWRTAREVIDWQLKGSSVFARKKALAPNTFRRLAIGLVKYGLKEFLMPSHKGWSDANVRSADEPLTTLTTKSRAEGLVEPDAYLIPNFGERPTQQPRTHSVEEPLPTVTSHGAGGLVEVQPYVLPKDQGWQGDYVRDIDSPLGTSQTTAVDHLAQPEMQALEPQLDNLRGTGVTLPVSEPLRTVTAGGQHQALAEAFMMAIDQTGGGRNHGTYGVDEPVRTIVTKNNASCIEFELVEVEERFLKACEEKGVDTTRAQTFLGYLVTELHKTGRLDAKPWIYVYYSNGSEGSAIDEPLPTVRTKAGTAVCYPVIELDGKMLKIDLLYRMLTTLELQRAMGFPDTMTWAGATQTEKIKAIGNSVSHGVARALGLAWYGQDENIAKYDEPTWTSKKSH